MRGQFAPTMVYGPVIQAQPRLQAREDTESTVQPIMLPGTPSLLQQGLSVYPTGELSYLRRTPVQESTAIFVQPPPRRHEIAENAGLPRCQIRNPENDLGVLSILTPGFDCSKHANVDIVSAVTSAVGEYNVFVTLKGYSVIGDVEVATSEYSSVGTAAIDALLSPFRRKTIVQKPMLNDVSTAFAPGKLCLVLGPPKSGKTTLLKSITQRLEPSIQASSDGELLFNGFEISRSMASRVAAYVPQVDQHFARLTCHETLSFSYDCQSASSLKSYAAKYGAKYDPMHRPKANLLMNLFGLHNCKDTIVGDEGIRGMSGGEKKRITSAEILCGQAMVLALDEVSTGLDSAATFDIVNSLREFCHGQKSTIIVSLLQPPPDVFNLFDEVVLMGSGQIIYHGPVGEVERFVQEQGFKRPDHVDMADFLVDICTSDAQLYFHPKMTPPCNIEMAKYWQRSPLRDEYIGSRFGIVPTVNRVLDGRYQKEYDQSAGQLIRLNIRRFSTIIWRDTRLISQRMRQVFIQGLMVGHVFWKAGDAEKVPLNFLLIVMAAMGNMYIINVVSARRAIFYKHRDANFWPTWVYTLSEFLAELPLQVLESTMLSSVSYFMVGLQDSAFPTYVLTMILNNVAFNNFFKAITAHTNDASSANGLAMGVMALSFCYCGFLITEGSMPDYCIWLHWMLPLGWINRLIALNEFKSSHYDATVQLQPGVFQRYGDLILKSASISGDNDFVKWCFMYMAGMILISNIVYTLGLHYRRLGAEKRKIIRRKQHNGRIPMPVASPPCEIALTTDGSAQQVLHSLSVQPPRAEIGVKDLSYIVQVPGESNKKVDKVLLNSISAIFSPGSMTALMGSSGAGKTTLMDVIAGRKTSGTISGEILVNGFPQDLNTFSRYSGYVEQNNIHMETMTVLEALRFSALHRLPRDLPDDEKEKLIRAVVEMVELQPILNAVIGARSIEEKKRVTIAVEMAANPSVLFLDEPTSGLDSRSARIVMRVVRRIASSGRTVICTIHQPSFEIFSMFDSLLLLKRGGWTVYNGSLGPFEMSETGERVSTAKDLVAYFQQSSSSVHRFQKGRNPAEYMLEVIGGGTAAAETAVDFVDLYTTSSMHSQIIQALQRGARGEKLAIQHTYAATVVRQYYLSTVRWCKGLWRFVDYSKNRLLMVVVVSFVFPLSIKTSSMDQVTDQALLQSYNGALFAGCLFPCAIQAVMTVGVIGDSKLVYYREQASKYYSASAFLFGLTAAEIPWLLLVAMLHTCIFYPLLGLYPDFFYVAHYTLAIFLFATTFCFWGQMISALLPTTEMASLLTGASMGILNFYSGFFVAESSVPWPWRVLFYLSPSRIGLKAIMPPQFFCDLSCLPDNQSADLPIKCQDASITSLASEPYYASGPGCTLMTDVTGYVRAKLGEEAFSRNFGEHLAGSHGAIRMTVWDYWSITTESSNESVWNLTLLLVGYIVLFRLITWAALKYVRHINR